MIAKILIVIMWLLHMCVDYTVMANSDTQPWWTVITYSFAHATIWHLIINSIAIYCLDNRFEQKKIVATIAIISAVITGAIIPTPIPTVGASSIAFAYIGIILLLLRSIRSWLILITSFVITAFISSVNLEYHISSMLLGIIIYLPVRHIKNLYDESKRFN